MFLSVSISNLSILQTDIALMYDAVHLFAKAMDELDQSQVRLETRITLKTNTNLGIGDHNQTSQLLWR